MEFAYKLLEHINFKKKIRWNTQTRDYETLYLNDANQTKKEYVKGFLPTDDKGVWALKHGADELLENTVGLTFEMMMDYYDEAFKIKPDHPVLLYWKGAFLFDCDNMDEALILMERVLEIDSHHGSALNL